MTSNDEFIKILEEAEKNYEDNFKWQYKGSNQTYIFHEPVDP